MREPTGMPADDDSALAQAAQDGDMAAFGLLLARHRPVLLALCRRTLGDPMLAEDAAQEAGLQALLNLDRLHQRERFGSWLAGIGLNVCRMWLRGRARECWSWDALNKTLERSEGTGVEITEVARHILRLVTGTEGQSDPEVHVEIADLSACVRRAVDTLPHGQRTAVLLFYLSGLSYKETANLLGIEVGAVRTRLHKARGALRGHLRALGEEEHLVMGSEQTKAGTTLEGEQRKVYICSFCGKKNHEVRRMIAGPGAIICNECIDLCNQIIAEEIAQEEANASAQ